MKGLIQQYKKSLRLLKSAKVVPMEYSRMVSDTQWAIELMRTGHIPGTKWTVARWSRDKREILCDPIEMSRYVRQQAPIESAPEHMVKLLENLMKTLTANEKQAYELVRGRLYSFTQAAQLMKCSKGTIQSYIKRAEIKIQDVLKNQSQKFVC